MFRDQASGGPWHVDIPLFVLSSTTSLPHVTARCFIKLNTTLSTEHSATPFTHSLHLDHTSNQTNNPRTNLSSTPHFRISINTLHLLIFVKKQKTQHAGRRPSGLRPQRPTPTRATPARHFPPPLPTLHRPARIHAHPLRRARKGRQPSRHPRKPHRHRMPLPIMFSFQPPAQSILSQQITKHLLK